MGEILDKNTRNKKIIKVSIIGIIANIVLSCFKAFVGFITGSIAIVLDAINNITDVASSIVTIIGTKLANKDPDKEHPFGHGRAEYLTAILIAMIILYAGITALIESVKIIINPIIPNYTAGSLIIVIVAIVVKILLGKYVKRKGKELKSTSLINSGTDASFDAIISFSTLVAAIIFIITNIPLEAYLGAIIALYIIKAGIDMIKEAVSSVLGERVDPKLVKDITKTIMKFEEVGGVYDLALNNYGPNTYTGSLHIEIPDMMVADEIDKLERNITEEVYNKHGVIITAIGIYSVNTKNKKIDIIKQSIDQIINKYDSILQYHGLYIDEEEKTIRFDIVISFDEKDRDNLYKSLYNEVLNKYPDYELIITIDTDISVSK